MTEIINLREPDPEPKGDFCLTPTARDIHHLLHTCQSFGWLGVVVGEPGTGKTAAITDYAARAEGGDVRLCRMTRAASRLQQGLVRLAEALGCGSMPNVSASELYNAVRYRAGWMSNGLLILDEAQHLEDDLLEALRDLFDEVRDDGVVFGVVLVGNRGLMDRLSKTDKRRGRAGFSQFTGRIGAKLDLSAPKAADVEALCAHHGIDGKRAVALVKKAAQLPGALQKVRNLFGVARELGDGAITLKTLEDAAPVVGIPNLKGGAA